MKRFIVPALASLIVAVFPAAADTSVVFNEVMFHPATNEPAMEWVELYNQMAVDVDLSNWSLDGDIRYRFGPNTVLHGGAFLVVAISPTNLAAATGLANILGPFTGRLPNSAGHLLLRNNNGRIVNELDYLTSGDWPVAPDGAGVSLAKLDHGTASDAPENWAASAQMGGTPGRENFPATPVVVPLAFNEFSATTNTSFWVELMNYGTNTLPLGGYVIVRDGVTNGEYLLAPGTTLPGGGFLALSNAATAFQPVAGDKLYLLPPARTNVLDAVVLKAGARGRSPDGTGPWLNPASPTPGAPNQFAFHREIVINEIMYHHQVLPAAATNLPPSASDEAWLELYNRSTNTVDLSGWKLESGIHYNFPAGKTIGPGAYLVVARNSAALRAAYPSIDIVGDYSGKLSHNGDSIVLDDAAGNPVNSVRYYTAGRWAAAADGGGSSLELRDPNADNSRPEAWAASDESGKSPWQTYTYQGVAQTIVGPELWNDFLLGMLNDGECLVDDISVVESPDGTPVEFIANGGFENGATGWRFLGNHLQSLVETEPGNPANHVLHVVATGQQEDLHNHIETTFAAGRKVTNGRTYQVSFRAKWLRGINLLNTRLYYDRVAKTTALLAPQLNGTPGARNSRYAANIGPTFSQFRHQPAVPAASQAVTVSVVARDPQGVSACEVWWSANGAAFAHAAMTTQGSGLYSGTIPGLAAGTIVQFYVRAVDGLGAVSTFPAGNTTAGALYMVNDGQANLGRGHNFRVILSPSNWALLRATTNLMSQAFLPGTLIYDEQRPYYDLGVTLKGSQSGRVGDPYPSFHLKFQPDDFFKGVHPDILLDTSGRPGVANQQEEILVHHMANHAGGIPDIHPDTCRVIPPYSTNTASGVAEPRFQDEFIATAYTNGEAGTAWLMELNYYPTTANSAGYKLPSPQVYMGVDIADLGDDKETYRYNFIIRNHRAQDDYSRFIRFAKTLSMPNGPALDAQSQQVMDVDEWLRTFALVSLVGELDWYTFGNSHNLIIYNRPADRRMLAFLWDVEQLFQRPADSSLIGSQGNFRDIESVYPQNLRRLFAHALDIITTTFNTSYMTYWAAHYASFAPGQDYSDLLSWIPQRTASVLAEINAAGGNSAFSVASASFITTSSNLVTLSGTAPVQVQSLLVNGIAYPVTWTSVSQWSLSVPVSSPTNVLNLAACDLNGNSLANYARTITVAYTGPAPNPSGAVVFNEIQYNPLIPGASYVELLNASPTASFDLSNWHVNELGCTFPPGTIMTSGQYLLLVKDKSAFINAYGTFIAPFDEFPGQLQPDGQTLTLTMPAAQVNQPDIVVAKVKYSAAAPWPPTSPGVSLQLVDPGQDQFRVGNWASALANTPAEPQWVYVSATGTASSSLLYIYLQAAGDVYLDDLKLVAGSVPEVGPNLLADGDFESGFPGPWTVSPNLAGSSLSTAIKHSGAASLHVAASSGGSSQSSAIWQTIAPALTANAPYTLSFWFLQSTNPAVPMLTIRLSGSGIVAEVDPASSTGSTGTAATPGSANSVRTTLLPFPPLWINELEADNLTGITNRAGQRTPWLELYNPTTNTVALTNLYLARTYTNLATWAFPPGAVINPGQFQVIFADGQTNLSTADEWHTSFTLSSEAGSVALSRMANAQPQVIDYVDYTNLTPNHSYGSFPDGQSFDRQAFARATPGGANQGSTGGSFIAYTSPGSVYNQDFNSLPNPGVTSVNSANPVTINGVTYSLPNPFDFASPAVASGTNGGLGLPLLAGWYGLADPSASVGTRFGASYGDQATGGQISFGLPNSTNRALGLLATSSTGFTAFGARLINHTPYTLNRINLQFTGEVWRQSDKPKTLQVCYRVDPAATTTLQTNATACLPALNVSFPAVPAAVGGVAVDGTLPINQANLSVLGQVISDWPPGAALWLVWTMADSAGSAQGLGIDNLSFSAWAAVTNTSPVLGALTNRLVHIGQTVSFTATATDAESPPQLLTFSLDPGAPPGATIGSASGLFAWPTANAVVPSTNTITIRVTDNGVPPSSDASAFSVTVLPLPQFGTTRLAGSTLSLSFSTLPGQSYQLEYKDNLAAPSWTLLSPPVPGTGGLVQLDQDTTGHAQRFYRLIVLP